MLRRFQPARFFSISATSPQVQFITRIKRGVTPSKAEISQITTAKELKYVLSIATKQQQTTIYENVDPNELTGLDNLKSVLEITKSFRLSGDIPSTKAVIKFDAFRFIQDAKSLVQFLRVFSGETQLHLIDEMVKRKKLPGLLKTSYDLFVCSDLNINSFSAIMDSINPKDFLQGNDFVALCRLLHLAGLHEKYIPFGEIVLERIAQFKSELAQKVNIPEPLQIKINIHNVNFEYHQLRSLIELVNLFGYAGKNGYKSHLRVVVEESQLLSRLNFDELVYCFNDAPFLFTEEMAKERFRKDVSSFAWLSKLMKMSEWTRTNQLINLLGKNHLVSLIKTPAELAILLNHNRPFSEVLRLGDLHDVIKDVETLLSFVNHEKFDNRMIIIFQPEYIADLCLQATEEQREQISSKIRNTYYYQNGEGSVSYDKQVQSLIKTCKEVEEAFSPRPGRG